jgi:hypothetical protein
MPSSCMRNQIRQFDRLEVGVPLIELPACSATRLSCSCKRMVISGFASEKTDSKSSVCRRWPVSPDHADDRDDEEYQHGALGAHEAT